MVMICQQCGDEGFTNAFIYCVECLGFVIHRYCLDLLPKAFDEFVNWYCEDCKPKSSYQSTFPCHNSLRTPEKDFASSVNCEEIYSKEKLNTNKDTASLVDGLEIYGFQETTIEHLDSPVKVNLKKRKKRHSDYLLDEMEEGNGNKVVIRESDSEHVQLTDSPIELDSKRKKTGNTASLLERTEENSYCESIGEPDLECDSVSLVPFKKRKKRKKLKKILSLVDESEEDSCAQECAPFKMQKKMTKVRKNSNLVDEAEEDSCHKLSTELAQECAPLAELCIREKIRKVKKNKCSDLTVAGKEEDNGHGELTKEPNCLGSPLANLQVEKRLKKTTKEKETGLVDVKGKSSSQLVINLENNSNCSGSETRKDKFQRSFNDPSAQYAKSVHESLQDVHIQAQPVKQTIWEGSFDIANKDYEIYAVGHVSSKVCPKVFKEASLLPSMLSLEMLPKSDLWPKSFFENKPSDDNIALYFFPAAPEHDTVFDSLMDVMMTEELAMRAVLTNAELLIFTSEELPKDLWRFRNKFYLWGVFRGKRVNPPPANNYLLNSMGSDRCDPHTNSLKKTESGKRTQLDSKGSEGSDQRTNSSNKVECGKRNQHDSKGSDQRTNSSNKVECGKGNQYESKGSDPHTNSSNKVECGKRNQYESKGSDPHINSSNKVEHGKRNQHGSKGSDLHTNTSKKVESGKRDKQESTGSEKSSPLTNSSRGKCKGKPRQSKSFGRRKEFSKSFKQQGNTSL